jgi:Ni/Fe-hydrogenase subunit HybB-like protein
MTMKQQIASASQKPRAFARDFFSYAIKGGNLYYGWLFFLAFFVIVGLFTSYVQMTKGLIVTGATDQILWELFISNFIFTAHIAAAAVLVVIPAYIYKREDMKHLAVLGEVIALTFVIIGLNFIFYHLGRPDRFWHAIPGLGIFNFPNAMLTYDVIVLNTYLAINLIAVSYLLYKRYIGQPLNTKFYTPLIYLAVVWGPLIHIVTAFILSSNAEISAWHTAVLPFAFLSMAGASGAALVIVMFLLIRKFTKLTIADSVIDFFSQVIVWSLGIIILVSVSEIFTELYTNTHHASSMKFMMFGQHGLDAYVPWFWTVMAMIVIPFILLLSSKVRKSYNSLLPVICFVVFMGILIEKPFVLVFPAFSPTPLGEYAVYHPTFIEICNVLFIWAVGFIILTLLTKGAVGVLTGEVRESKTVEATGEVK